MWKLIFKNIDLKTRGHPHPGRMWKLIFKNIGLKTLGHPHPGRMWKLILKNMVFKYRFENAQTSTSRSDVEINI